MASCIYCGKKQSCTKPVLPSALRVSTNKKKGSMDTQENGLGSRLTRQGKTQTKRLISRGTHFSGIW